MWNLTRVINYFEVVSGSILFHFIFSYIISSYFISFFASNEKSVMVKEYGWKKKTGNI